MNEDTKTPEPLADILAEMRREAGAQTNPSPLYRYADRIEAAYKREHAEWHAETEAAKDARNRVANRMRSEFTAKCRDCTERAPVNAAPRKFDEAAFDAAVSKPNGWSGVADTVAEIRRMRDGDAPGDAAAMRDALLYARNTLVLYSRDMKPRYQAEVGFMIDKCDAALSAPARNCDLIDANGAWKGFLARGNNAEISASYQTGANAAIRWLYAAAEGGDHA